MPSLNDPISTLPLVGPQRAKAFRTAGLNTVRDLLWYFPFRHIDRTTIISIARAYNYTKNGYDGEFTLIGRVRSFRLHTFGKKKVFAVRVADDSGELDCIWFQGIQYFSNAFTEGDMLAVSGKPSISKRGDFQLIHPVFDKFTHDESSNFFKTGKIIPVYSVNKFFKEANLGETGLRRIIDRALASHAGSIEETLPQSLIKKRNLNGLKETVEEIHNPTSLEQVKKGYTRLKYEEFFYFQLNAVAKRENYKKLNRGIQFSVQTRIINDFIESLPFRLTKAQIKVLGEIKGDMFSPQPMMRLLQGDVGSGKTVVALISMLMAIDCGYQAVLMVPTEVLAAQHFKSIKKFLAPFLGSGASGVEKVSLFDDTSFAATSDSSTPASVGGSTPAGVGTTNSTEEAATSTAGTDDSKPAVAGGTNPADGVVINPTNANGTNPAENNSPFTETASRHNITIGLLTGSTSAKERNRILPALAEGKVDILVGTHALFEDKVEFSKLGLIVIDEQHRFGVEQRARLLQKSATPDVLVMTATPIPRTLSMTVFGELDVSVINELPANRVPVKTAIRGESALGGIYDFIRTSVRAGRQAFIVYPLVEESEKLDLKAAEQGFTEIATSHLPDLKIGLLHGRMKWREKEEVMNRFVNREFDILVSTTVIEVGVDIPNATVMLINEAHRFGLSQLHQLRGRIGRGAEQSYCILVTKDEIVASAGKISQPVEYLPQGVLERLKTITRLKAMEESNDGFKLSEIDLRMRGPGDIFGKKQSGIPDFRFCDIANDSAIMFEAKEDAQKIVLEDPTLTQPENRVIAKTLDNLISSSENFYGIG